jgi:hypothetical protein
MPKITTFDNEGGQSTPKPGGAPSWLADVNNIVGNIKEIAMIQKGLKAGGAPGGNVMQTIETVMRLMGYDKNTPIGLIIQQIAPLSINQLEEKIKGRLLSGNKPE